MVMALRGSSLASLVSQALLVACSGTEVSDDSPNPSAVVASSESASSASVPTSEPSAAVRPVISSTPSASSAATVDTASTVPSSTASVPAATVRPNGADLGPANGGSGSVDGNEEGRTGAGGSNSTGSEGGASGKPSGAVAPTAGGAGGSNGGARSTNAGGAGGGNAVTQGTDGTPIPGPNFDTLKFVFNESPCYGGSCHNSPRNHLQVDKPDDILYDYLLSFTTLECGKLIDTQNPPESAIVKYLRGPCGTIERMPATWCVEDSDPGCIPEEYIQAIEQWIADGAPR